MYNKITRTTIKSLFLSAILAIMLLPVFSQDTNGFDFDFDSGPVSIAVVDFINKSGYKIDNPGKTMAASIALSFENDRTLKFESVDPAVVSAAMRELGYNSTTAGGDEILLSRLADHIGVLNIVTGEIREIKLIRDKSGSYAEVTVHARAINRITRLPINGATVTQRSAAILGYTGNGDTLINEALTTAGYRLVQTMLSNRFPYTSVILSSNSNAIQLRGNNGWQVGQKAVVIRGKFRTATLVVTDVTSATTICRVTDSTRGVSTSDMALAIYEEHPGGEGPSNPKTKKLIYGGIGAVVLAGLLYTLADNVEKQGRWVDSPTAYPIANVAMSKEVPIPGEYEGSSASFPYGGNYVSWKRMEGAAYVAGYAIFREEPSQVGRIYSAYPIAIVPGDQTYYIDAVPSDYYARYSNPYNPLNSSGGARATYVEYQYELADESNPRINAPIIITEFEGMGIIGTSPWPPYQYYLDYLPVLNSGTRDDTSYSIGVLNRAPAFGDLCRYRVEAIYSARDTSTSTGTDEEYTYIMRSTMSGNSNESMYIKYPVYMAQSDSSGVTIQLANYEQKDQYDTYISKYKLQLSPYLDFSRDVVEITNIDQSSLSFRNIQSSVITSGVPLELHYFRVGIAPISSATQPKKVLTGSYPNYGPMDGYVWSYPIQISSTVLPNTYMPNINLSIMSKGTVNALFQPKKGGRGGRGNGDFKGRSYFNKK